MEIKNKDFTPTLRQADVSGSYKQITYSPCSNCAKLLVNSGFRYIMFHIWKL